MEIKDFISVFISVFALLVNIVFYIFIAPSINDKLAYKKRLYDVSSEFLDYLVDATSFTSFDGVPSTVRKYSLKIHLLFPKGKAPDSLSKILESIFQHLKSRKSISEELAIDSWKVTMRENIKSLRVELSKYRNRARW